MYENRLWEQVNYAHNIHLFIQINFFIRHVSKQSDYYIKIKYEDKDLLSPDLLTLTLSMIAWKGQGGDHLLGAGSAQ